KSFVTGTAPTDFVVHLSQPYDQTSVQPSALTVNGTPADAVHFTDAATLTFHYDTSPVTGPGPQQLAIAEGAILRASDDSPIHAFSATFYYAPVRIAVASTEPADGSLVVLPLTSFKVHFNLPYDPASIKTSNLQLNQGSVTGFTLVDSTTVAYTVAGVVNEGTLTVKMAEGAVTDAFGDPVAAF